MPEFDSLYREILLNPLSLHCVLRRLAPMLAARPGRANSNLELIVETLESLSRKVFLPSTQIFLSYLKMCHCVLSHAKTKFNIFKVTQFGAENKLMDKKYLGSVCIEY